MNVVAYPDGSFCRRSKMAGWAYALRHPVLGHLEASGGLKARSSNEVEALALTHACERMLQVGVNGLAVVVYTDSESAMRVFPQEALLNAGAVSATVKHTHAHKGVRNAHAAMNGHVDALAKYEMRRLRDAFYRDRSDCC